MMTTGNVLKHIAAKVVAGIAAIVIQVESSAADWWGKTAAYYDTRGKPTVSLTGGASNLPLGADFFGFVDAIGGTEDKTKLDAVYGEFKLSKKLSLDVGAIGPSVEYNRDFLQPRGVSRAGITFEPNLSRFCTNGFFGVTFYPFATHADGMQVVLYGGKSFKEGKYYVEGFFDYNFRPENVVSEVQLGRRLGKKWYAVVEGRHNGFIKGNEWGVGLGLEKKF